MRKVIVLRGLPASGKSTWAKEQVRLHGYKRVNRDDLRQMLDDGKYSPENETLIKEIREEIIRWCIRRKQTVIVDDTNLKPDDLQYFIDLVEEDLEAELDVVVFDIPLDECIRRDAQREHPVGEQIIRDLYQKWIQI